MEKYIIFALVSMVFFGVYAIILKKAPNIDPVTLALIALITAALSILFYWILFVAKKEFSTEGMTYGIIGGIVWAIGFITFVIALKLGKASIVAPINALSAGVAVILAIIFLSESLSLIKIGGVVLAVIAVVLLSI